MNRIRKHKISLSLAILMGLSSFAHIASAQSLDLQKKTKNYFLQILKAQQKALENGNESFIKSTIADAKCETTRAKLLSLINNKELADGKNVTNYQKMVGAAWCEANKELEEEKLVQLEELKKGVHGTWTLPKSLEPNAVMPYYYGYKDDESSRKDGKNTSIYPLFIYLHGSGPKEQEWETGLKLGQMFKDAPAMYFIPQIPNEGNYYRWWQVAKQYAWEKLLRQTLAEDKVDANRLYVFGISEGGYGSQRLASFYADYWAAAGPMAGGEPLKNAPVENCANIGFSFLTGADDMGFYRNILTYYTQVAFDSAQLARPLSADFKPLFRHRINLLPGMQHSIDYRLTTPWLKNFVRNPYPKTVLWEDFEMDGRHRSGFYNLQVLARPSEKRTYYEMNINENTIILNISDVAYTTVMKDQQWGIDMKFNRSYTKAQGGKLRIYLNDQLVDLEKPITIKVNDKQVYHGIITPKLEDMLNSCAEYFDPCRVYPASIEINY